VTPYSADSSDGLGGYLVKMDNEQREKIRAEMMRINKGQSSGNIDYMIFAGMCVNLFIANMKKDTRPMEKYIKKNNLHVLLTLNQEDLAKMSKEAISNYLGMSDIDFPSKDIAGN